MIRTLGYVAPVDDAGGGRRGRRPSASTELVEAVRREYGLSLLGARDIGGSTNLNLLADRGDSHLVVRAYRAHVTSARVSAIQEVRACLAANGLPCAEPVLTRGGATVIEVGRNVVEVEAFVDSDVKMDSLDRVAAALPTLAELHGLLATVDPGEGVRDTMFSNYIDPADVIELTRHGTDRIRTWQPTDDERALADAADRLAEAITQAQEPFTDLPRQLVHGDYWDSNVLSREGAVVLVTDFDFMGNRLRIDDLALTLYFTSYLLEDPLSDDGMRQLARLVDAYDTGSADSLSPQERAALPVALARQPLWSIAVWAAGLDDLNTARVHLKGHLHTVNRSLRLLDALDAFRNAFT